MQHFEEMEYIKLVEECLCNHWAGSKTFSFDFNKSFPILRTRDIDVNFVLIQLFWMLKGGIDSSTGKPSRMNNEILREMNGLQLVNEKKYGNFIFYHENEIPHGIENPQNINYWDVRAFNIKKQCKASFYGDLGFNSNLRSLFNFVIKIKGNPISMLTIGNKQEQNGTEDTGNIPFLADVSFFFKDEKSVSMNVYFKKSDVFWHTPAEITFYAMFLKIVAYLTNRTPVSMDFHIEKPYISKEVIMDLHFGKPYVSKEPFLQAERYVKSAKKSMINSPYSIEKNIEFNIDTSFKELFRCGSKSFETNHRFLRIHHMDEKNNLFEPLYVGVL